MGVFLLSVVLTILITLLVLFYFFKIKKSKQTVKENFKFNIIKQLTNTYCSENIPVFFYKTESDVSTYFQDTRGKYVYWDNRYGNIKSKSFCVNNIKTHNTFMDLFNPSTVSFGGPQSTLVVKPRRTVFPWSQGNSFMLQLNKQMINFTVKNGTPSGNICFNMFVSNVKTNERINILSNLITFGYAWTEEQKDILYDPSTNTKFISTNVSSGNKWSTSDGYGNNLKIIKNNINDTNREFFRTIFSNKNFLNILKESKFDLDLNNWKLDFVAVQTEIEEDSGLCKLEFEFSDFSTFIIKEI